jgi:isoleucyl-tRNA synthetase
LSLPAGDLALLDAAQWTEIAIVSDLTVEAGADVAASVTLAAGQKCVRCWRVLTEVGASAAHPALCVRCEDAVTRGLACATVAA